MNLFEKIENFKNLFKQKKFDELINQIDEIEEKNSFIINIYAAAKLLRNDIEKKDKLSALQNFEKAYLMDKSSEHALNSLGNYINLATEYGEFKKIFKYYNEATDFFGENIILLEAIQRTYRFLHRPEDRNKILKKLIDKKTNSIIIWSSYLYTNNFISSFFSQKQHFDLAIGFEKILTDFQLPKIDIDNNKNLNKLRIAFFSSNLNQPHSVIYFLKDLLKNIDKNKFHITAICNWTSDDKPHKDILPNIDEWFLISKLSDLDAIKLIRSKNFHVVFDLMGMTGDNRPVIFKNRVSPIQINWLGYCNTSGINNMDYIFADPNLIENKDENYYFEKVKKLPKIWSSHSGFSTSRSLNDLPCLKSNSFTFGSFNNFNKISKSTLDCWDKILKQSKNSRLLLKSSVEHFPDHLNSLFKEKGIDNQITILKKTNSFEDHLEFYDKIDLALDTFPYNGVTTTFEALWKSVPVLILKGFNFKSRCGYSILKGLDVEDLIANNLDEYVSKAIYFSHNFDHLKDIKKQIFLKLKESCLFDTKSFTTDFQNLILDCIKEKNIF